MRFTQTGRSLRFDSPLGSDVLLLIKVVIKEYFDQPYHLTLQLLSVNPALAAKDILGQPGKVTLFGHTTRIFQGIVTQFTPAGFDKRGYRFYQIILQPWTSLLDKQNHFRYYYQQSIPNIVRQLGLSLSQTILTNELQDAYTECAMIAQYQETDLQFMQRLLAQAKIYYRFLQDARGEILVLQDTLIDKNQRSIALEQCTVEQHIYAQQIQLKNYQFTHPKQAIIGHATQQNIAHLTSFATELFYYQHAVTTQTTAEDLANRLLTEQQRHAQQIDGVTNAIDLQPGCIYQFQYSQQNHAYTVLSIEHTAWDYSLLHSEDIPLTEKQQPVATKHYQNRVRLQAAQLPLYPLFQCEKKQVSIQTAFVTAPSQQAVYTNHYGAIKIKFPWQATDNVDIADLPWARVCQWQAGNHWGSQFIPRAGDEVVVGFIHGDLTRPVILGSLYNQQNQPPYPLPQQANISALRTQIIGKTLGHELAFDDTLHQERWRLWVQGDYQQITQHDQQTTIAGDDYVSITQDFITQILQGHSDIQAKTATFQVGNHAISFTQNGIHFQGSKIFLKASGVGGSFPVARQGDAHCCYQLTSDGAHEGGAIYTGSPTLKINQQFAARLGDKAHCLIQADTISQGVANILVDGQPLACVKHKTEHDGLLTTGSPTVFVHTSTA